MAAVMAILVEVVTATRMDTAAAAVMVALRMATETGLPTVVVALEEPLAIRCLT